MTSANDFDWTESAILRLRDLWAEGHSAAQIGYQLGCSKNAVIGKSRRLDLPRRPSPIRDASLGPSKTPDAIRRRAYRQRTLAGDMVEVRRLDGSTRSVPFSGFRKEAVVGETLTSLPSLAKRTAAVLAPEPTIILPPNLNSRCCYVVDDTRMQQRYCDAPAPLGSSWCVEHARQVFVPDHFPDWCKHHHVRIEAATEHVPQPKPWTPADRPMVLREFGA